MHCGKESNSPHSNKELLFLSICLYSSCTVIICLDTLFSDCFLIIFCLEAYASFMLLQSPFLHLSHLTGLFNHLPIVRHFGYFWFFTMVSNSTGNILQKNYSLFLVFLRKNFQKYLNNLMCICCHIVLQKVCTISLHSIRVKLFLS